MIAELCDHPLSRRTLRPIIRRILVTSALRWRHMVTSALSPSSRWRRPAFSCTHHHQVLRHLQPREPVLPPSPVQQVPGMGRPIGTFANLTTFRSPDLQQFVDEIQHSEWDPAYCGWDPAYCGWDPAYCGWDPAYCGWDPAYCGWDPA